MVYGLWKKTDLSEPVSQQYATAVRLADGKVLLLTGDPIKIYDPVADQWGRLPGPSFPVAAPAAQLLSNGKVLVAGGLAYQIAPTAAAELYDPATQRFKPAHGMRVPRGRFALVALTEGTVLALGGNPTDPRCEQFEPATESWALIASMHFPHFPSGAVALGGSKFLAVGPRGDYDGGGFAEVYDAASDEWTVVGVPSQTPTRFTLNAAGPGKALLVGDRQTAEIFDLATGNWKTTPPLSTPRTDHGAVTLDDGNVIVAGGGGIPPWSSGRLKSAEVYEPALDTWTEIGPMVSTHIYPTATLLKDRRVLISGGIYGDPETFERQCPGDFSCPATQFCEAGHCVSRRLLGAACDRDRACASAFCVDHLCCDSACAGPCQHCNTPDAGGSCRAVATQNTGVCYPFACGPAPDCPTTCATATDCVDGLVCEAGKCVSAIPPPVVSTDGGQVKRPDAGVTPAPVGSCGCSSAGGLGWVAVLLLARGLRRRTASESFGEAGRDVEHRLKGEP